MTKRDGKYDVLLNLRITRFELPPVRDTLVIGRMAPIGPHAIHKSLEEMTPGKFDLVESDHEIIEAFLVRKSDLRKVPREDLIAALTRRVEGIMDAGDALHVHIDMEISTSAEIALSGKEQEREAGE